MELQQGGGQELAVVADVAVPDRGHGTADQLHAQLGAGVLVVAHRLSPLLGVALGDLPGDAGGVDRWNSPGRECWKMAWIWSALV